jgi:hypothetical protein
MFVANEGFTARAICSGGSLSKVPLQMSQEELDQRNEAIFLKKADNFRTLALYPAKVSSGEGTKAISSNSFGFQTI